MRTVCSYLGKSYVEDLQYLLPYSTESRSRRGNKIFKDYIGSNAHTRSSHFQFAPTCGIGRNNLKLQRSHLRSILKPGFLMDCSAPEQIAREMCLLHASGSFKRGSGSMLE